MKLAYRGVLIERPCVNCDTVDIHFEGRCNSGPCQDFESNFERTGKENIGSMVQPMCYADACYCEKEVTA